MPKAITQLIQMLVEQLRDNPGASQAELIAQVERAIAANPPLEAALRANPQMLQTNRDRATGFQTVVKGGTVYIGGTQYVFPDSEKLQALLAGVFQQLQTNFNVPHDSGNLTSMQRQRLEERRDGLQEEWKLRSSKLKRLRAAVAIEASTVVEFQLKKQIQTEEAELTCLEAELNQIEQTLNYATNLKQNITLGIEEEINYRYDIFISLNLLKESDDITMDWINKCFLPIIKQALENHLSFPPKIYLPSPERSHQESNLLEVSEELSYSRCLIPIWRPSYFYDSDYHIHCSIMRKREQHLDLRPGSLIWPVIISDGDSIPQDFSMITSHINCYKYVKTRRMLEQSDTLLNYLHDMLSSWAEGVAKAINSVPEFNKKWIEDSNIDVTPKYLRPKSQRPRM